MQTFEFNNAVELVDGFRYALDAESELLLRSTTERAPVLEFARSVVAGFEREQPRLDCRFLYDDRGSALYEQICEQPEYYLTRAEDETLATCKNALRETTGPVRLLELGSGNAVKTDHVLTAWLNKEPNATYVPVDVSEVALRKAGAVISARHDGVQFLGINATYEEAMSVVQPASPVMVMFMGSTVGNLDVDEEEQFWLQISSALNPGDFFLLGIDLVKDPDVIKAAYNDSAGVTAKFTLNLFERMNRELGSCIDVDSLTHEARYNEEAERIETHVLVERPLDVQVAPLDRVFHVDAGTRILVEISRKFRVGQVADMLTRYGMHTVADYSDERKRFALLLLRYEAAAGDH